MWIQRYKNPKILARKHLVAFFSINCFNTHVFCDCKTRICLLCSFLHVFNTTKDCSFDGNGIWCLAEQNEVFPFSLQKSLVFTMETMKIKKRKFGWTQRNFHQFQQILNFVKMMHRRYCHTLATDGYEQQRVISPIIWIYFNILRLYMENHANRAATARWNCMHQRTVATATRS